MDWLDFMSSEHFHVLLHPDQRHGLIFNRLDDTVATINHNDAIELSNLKKVGRVYGIVGRYLGRYLVLIKSRTLIGTLYEPKSKTEHEIYVINQVQVVDILSNHQNSNRNSVRYDVASAKIDELNQNDGCDTGIATREFSNDCCDPEDFSSLPITISTSSYVSMQSRTQWNPFKLANSLRMPTNFLKSTSSADSSANSQVNGAPLIHNNNGASTSQANLQSEDSDKRLVEEMMKLFNNTNSFYYSPTLDLTNRFSRNSPVKSAGNEALWKTAETRFFWNKHMLKDLIDLSKRDSDANYFICIILQGFVAIERILIPVNLFNHTSVEHGILATSFKPIEQTNTSINVANGDSSTFSSNIADDQLGFELKHEKLSAKSYKLALVSRRSVLQAGTRYRRRGCDEDGNCANFVETEQIFIHKHHFTSVIILRGSIPLFWYQTGYNYRPPPVLYRSEEENHSAFNNHFQNLIEAYKTDHIIAIDCTEQSGREKSLHDAYRLHMKTLQASKPNLKLIEFDFHKFCRGRQCSDVQVEKHLRSCGLTDSIVKESKYYWNDGEIVWNQNGIFRVNCLDCSDRTNVVQRAIALQILDLQLARLGVITPDTCPDNNEWRKIMQLMWSTNGNVLSTQYCGTRALFTGDRKLSGYLKDTYSSASRYYISKFRDAYRQAAIDAMLGVDTVSNNNFKPLADQQGSKNLDSDELDSIDPEVLTTQGGSTLLKDVGSRVSNRLARLTGKFYVRPSDVDSTQQNDVTSTIEECDPESGEMRVADGLRELSIDWPSSESVVENVDAQASNNSMFTQLANNDDSFQDDEFGQLMLSIDLSELQRLRDDESKNDDGSDRGKSEEIDMRETRGLKTASSSDSKEKVTSTTST